MPSRVFANGMGLSHARGGGVSTVFPAVCVTPSAGGPVAVPYASVGRSADVRGGSKRVKVQGASTMLQGSVYRRSTGDEAGSAGGVASGTTAGACECSMYSLDVCTRSRGRRCTLDTPSNMKTQPRWVHRKRHKKCGDQFHRYPTRKYRHLRKINDVD